MLQTLRLITLLLFVPTALLPVQLDVCLACVFGVESCATVEGEEDCCCCSDRPSDQTPRSCCAVKAETQQGPELRSSVPVERDCCIHIDNARDELPAPAVGFDLPPQVKVEDLAFHQPVAARLSALRPVPAPTSGPPPNAVLPLLI